MTAPEHGRFVEEPVTTTDESESEVGSSTAELLQKYIAALEEMVYRKLFAISRFLLQWIF
jgi:hypothetical protein